VLQHWSTVAGTVTVFGVSHLHAVAQAKLSKKDVGYQVQPKGNQQRETCISFQPPTGCKVAEGEVTPHGPCMAYAPKPIKRSIAYGRDNRSAEVKQVWRVLRCLDFFATLVAAVRNFRTTSCLVLPIIGQHLAPRPIASVVTSRAQADLHRLKRGDHYLALASRTKVDAMGFCMARSTKCIGLLNEFDDPAEIIGTFAAVECRLHFRGGSNRRKPQRLSGRFRGTNHQDCADNHQRN
jgi:hypothetical protein